MKKRILSLLLAIVMVLGMVPVFAMADEAATPESVVIDFADFVQKAKTQAFWQEMTAKEGTAEGTAGNVKYIGIQGRTHYAGGYEAMLEYLEDNYCWTIDEASSYLNDSTDTTTANKGIVLNANENSKWSLAFRPGLPGGGEKSANGSVLGLTVNVEEAGYYKIDTTAFYPANSTDFLEQTGINYAGAGGYADIKVNGASVCDAYAFTAAAPTSGTNPNTGWLNTTQTDTVGYAYFKKGANDLTIDVVGGYKGNAGSTDAQRCWIHLDSIELTYTAECSKVHEAGEQTTVCDVCGKVIVGTKPVEIATEAELIQFSQWVNDGATELDAVLTEDIALTNAWIKCIVKGNFTNNAIGTAEAPYAGTFDGQGHTISGLDIQFKNEFAVQGGTAAEDDFTRDFRLGLFGTVDGATIKNVTVVGAIALSGRHTDQRGEPGSSRIGGLIAMATDTTVTNCVSNVAVSGRANGATVAFANVGGLVGFATNLTMDKCGNEADLVVMASDIGGLVGWMEGTSKITNSYNTGKVDGYRRVGGIVGTVITSENEANPTVIDNCYNTGDFDSHTMNVSGWVADYTALSNAAGIVGRGKSADHDVMTYAQISNCYVSGNTTAPIQEGLYTALYKNWEGAAYITTDWDNNYFVGGKTYTGYHAQAREVSETELATAEFAAKLGDYVLLNGGTSPVLDWQCDHEMQDGGYIANGNETHTAIEECANCSKTVKIGDAVDCTDGDTDGTCDVCGGTVEVPCEHSETTSNYAPAGDGKHTVTNVCECGVTVGEATTEDCSDPDEDGYCVCGAEVVKPCEHSNLSASDPVFNAETKEHTITITCDDCDEYEEVKTEACTADDGTFDGKHTTTYKCSVCEGVLSVETTECTDTETSYVDNNNGTHMVTVTCNTCGEIVSETSADCTDFSDVTDEHTTTYTCNDCGYSYSEEDSTCEESEQTTTYEVAEGAYHTVKVTCDVCGETVSTETVPCTPGEAVVDENDPHHETISCIYCEDLIEDGYTGCIDDDHDQACDICGEPVECLHGDETTTNDPVDNEDGTHTIIVTCDWCDGVVSETTTPCTDADHDQACDVCGGPVACLHDGDNNKYYPQSNGTHNFRCEYCNELITGEECTFVENEFICDKCGKNVAVAEYNGEYYKTVAEAIAAADAEGTVKVLNTTTENVTINKSLTLDLGGKTLTGQIRVTAGDVVIQNGIVYVNEDGVDAIILGVKNQTEEEMTLTLDKMNAVSQTDCAVVLYDGTLTLNNGAYLISYSAKYAVLQGSGRDFGNADIYGTVVNAGNDLAIYWPQDGVLNIYDGSYIEGATAVYAKGGEVNISGGILKATGDAAEFDPSNNGGYATGDTLVVENAGGDYGTVEVSVTGGTFTSEKAEAVASYTRTDEKIDSFIEGGIFSTDVTEFCIEGYACKKTGNNYTPAEIETFESNGSNMTLGNDLILNVHFAKEDVDGAGRDLTAYIIHKGVETKLDELDDYNTNDYAVPFKIAAKQMTDEVTVELRDDCGNVYATKVETVADYAIRTSEKLLAEGDVRAATLLVDMVNYGAAAQEHFKYNVENLANAGLTDELKALATDAVDCKDNRVKGDNYVGSFLTLEDKLWLKFVFTGKVEDGYTATLTYTDYRGREQTAEGIIAPFGSFGRMAITTDKLVVADGYELVTVTVYDADGNVYGTATDSIEGYVARGTDEAIYSSIMKFVTSTKDYLLNR